MALRIKSNVDLKELEKFGFTEETRWYEKIIKYKWNDILYIYVDKDNKGIQISTYDGYDTYLDNTLYDLIKADLVEKVSDDNV